MDQSRRQFLKTTGLATAGVAVSARSYGRILGANDRVRVGVVGYSNRFKGSLSKAFMNHAKEMNFEFVAISDIWNKRRETGAASPERTFWSRDLSSQKQSGTIRKN